MTDRTQLRRLPERAVPDPAMRDAMLDAALVAHVAVPVEGQPFVLPMACARDGNQLLLHGSTGSRLMTALTAGASACATITLLDGLVYARSAFESSMHYRCVVVLGRAASIPTSERRRTLDVLTDHLLPGRRAELRPSTRKELAATRLVAFPLTEWSVKINNAPPDDPASDLDTAVWAGVLPLTLAATTPIDAPDLRQPHPVPPTSAPHSRTPHDALLRWHTRLTTRGMSVHPSRINTVSEAERLPGTAQVRRDAWSRASR